MKMEIELYKKEKRKKRKIYTFITQLGTSINKEG
jgi:hypothetical protein